jgi:hypothetical protein
MVDFVVVMVDFVVVMVDFVVVMVDFVVYLMIHFHQILMLLSRAKLEFEMCYYKLIN